MIALSPKLEAALKAASLTGDLAALLREIPDAILHSEVGRRRNAKVVNRSGGVVWSSHRPDYSRCRCRSCNRKRAAAAQ